MAFRAFHGVLRRKAVSGQQRFVTVRDVIAVDCGLASGVSFHRSCARSFATAHKEHGTHPPHVVIAGCGVAGASAAMQLVRRGANVTLVDPRPPLTASSQYSTECYRAFFLDKATMSFTTRSVEILEELAGEDNIINLNRRGYCFLASAEESDALFEEFAETASAYGGGPVRKHRGTAAAYERSPLTGFRHPSIVGFDLVYGSSAIQEIFPFVDKSARMMLHARQAGWMDAQGLGQAMLGEAKAGVVSGGIERRAQVVKGIVSGFDVKGGQVSRVHVANPEGERFALECDAFVNAAGAWMPAVNAILAPDSPLPLTNEIHAKTILDDTAGCIPQDAPFMVWSGSTTIPWDDDTREGLIELDDTEEGGVLNSASWLKPQPGGQHFRPAGNGRVLMLWEHLHMHVPISAEASMPVEHLLDMYPQLCLAGCRAMVPGLSVYDDRLGKGTTMDGGYYTNTPDARPLVGPHGARNAFVIGGMGTYGLMGSPAAGELLALHVLGGEMPSYTGACTWPRLDPLTEKPRDLLCEA
eukprot:TRINITY_DN5168_c0_g1_i1.p1 TRINITY_DN5168_c0_g1~~TRINITY_DN5168_c0_g1_i1.p1  ORF type:complete len:527 (-),score=73.81 TRINITY_DN5168_c0_g1_i1:109-1689(-)